MHDEASDAAPRIEIEEFWQWLQAHPNCILRAGTQHVVFYDHDDHHWMLSTDADNNYSVQMLRGKMVISQMRILVEEVAFVRQTAIEEEGERLYELFVAQESSEAPTFGAYHFLLAHGIEEDDDEQALPSSGEQGRGGRGGHWSH